MTEVDSKTYFPELVFCISAAAGTDSRSVSDALAAELAGVDYIPVPIKLSTLMAQIPGLEHLSELTAEDGPACLADTKPIAGGGQILARE